MVLARPRVRETSHWTGIGSPRLVANLGGVTAKLKPMGFFLTLGWVDIHTHYDGQATWDACLTPSLLASGDDGGDGQLRRGVCTGAPG